MKKSFIVLIVICSLLGIVGLLYKNNIIFNNKDISKEEDYSNIPYDTKDDVFNFKEDVVSLNTCEEIYKNYYNEKDGIMHLFEDFSYSVDYILNNKDKFNHPLIKCSDITFNDYAQDFIGAQGFCYEGEDIKLFNFYNFTNNEIMKEAEYFSTDYKRNDFILESQIYQLTKENKIIYVDNNLNIVTYDTKSKTPVYFISELNFFLLEYDNFIYPRLYVTNDNKLYTFNEIDATEWYKYKYLKSFTDNVKNKYNLYLNSYGNLLYYSEYDYDYNNVTPNILTDENNNNIKISKVILITNSEYLYFISNNKIYKLSFKNGEKIISEYNNKTIENTKTIYSDNSDTISYDGVDNLMCPIKTTSKFTIYYTDGTSEEFNVENISE